MKVLNQDTFDDDTGRKSAISLKFLHWIFLSFLQWIVVLFLQGLRLRKEMAPKLWRKLPDFRAEKKTQNFVTCLAVMVFSVPIEEKQAPRSTRKPSKNMFSF